MLAQADAIVRVTAIGVADPPPSQRRGRETKTIRFEVLEVLKGELPRATLLLTGRLVDHDDFNDHSPPHQLRPSGRSGSCYTDEYRAGREYLLLLKKSTEDVFWTTRWYPLGPVNEQLTGPEDAWLRWVRANVK
jgi:hypothetical protein